jgi:hypothetical protein
VDYCNRKQQQAEYTIASIKLDAKQQKRKLAPLWVLLEVERKRKVKKERVGKRKKRETELNQKVHF